MAECQAQNEKLLVFSQSLTSLNLIEKFLDSSWENGIDYFRMDGSTRVDLRSSYCEIFNDEKSQAR